MTEMGRLAPEPLVEFDRPPVDGYVRGKGELRLHYLDWGGSGPPILFLHGAGLNAHTWDSVCALLRDDYRCVALDLRGHGDSEWSATAEYDLDSYAADVDAVFRELGLARAVLVGMSLGGVVALTYAEAAAHPLAALVIVEAGPEPRANGRERIRDFMAQPEELDSVEDFVSRALAFNPLRRADILRRSLLNNLRQTPSGKWTWKYDRRGMSGPSVEQRMRRLPGLWKSAAKIECPALVVRGGDSDVFHDEDAEKLARTFADGRWARVEGARHTVQGDRPIALTAELRRFLDGIMLQRSA